MNGINNKLEEMITIFNNDPLSIEGKKSPLQLCQTRIFKHQVVDSVIDPDTLYFLSEW